MREGKFCISVLAVFVLAISFAQPVVAQESTGTKEEKAKSDNTQSQNQIASPSGQIIYKPPMRGAPGDRVGGGSRGLGSADLPQVTVLAPDHVGLTVRPQPVLYWYMSKPTAKTLEFTMNDESSGRTLLRTVLSSPGQGINRIDLATFNTSLESMTDYRWLITVVVDPEQPMKNITSGAIIRRVELPTDVVTTLKGQELLDTAEYYAQSGIWYDSIDDLSRLIDMKPQDENIQALRNDLLKQVGLRDVDSK